MAIIADDPAKFVVRFFAVLATGGTSVPLVPPHAMQERQSYDGRLHDALAAAGPVVVLGDGATGEIDGIPVLDPAGEGPVRSVAVAEQPADAPAVVQFSSGSSGSPKAMVLSRTAVDTNVRAITRWLGMGPSDRTASWLPLYHDMGLIGTTLVPIASQTDLFLMTPMQFLRRPETWLRCFGELRCTLTAAPPFGFGHAASRVDPDELRECDLSSWRVAIVGAEPLERGPLEAFADRFSVLGFRWSTFCPAYGMAEATLALTGTPPEQAPIISASDRGEADGRMAASDRRERGVVSSGPALPGVDIEIRDDLGSPLSDDHVGEIWVASPSLAEGFGSESGTDARRWYATGDAGFMSVGELYVLGRLADSFKVRGRRILAEHAESLIREALPDVRRRRGGAQPHRGLLVSPPSWRVVPSVKRHPRSGRARSSAACSIRVRSTSSRSRPERFPGRRAASRAVGSVGVDSSRRANGKRCRPHERPRDVRMARGQASMKVLAVDHAVPDSLVTNEDMLAMVRSQSPAIEDEAAWEAIERRIRRYWNVTGTDRRYQLGEHQLALDLLVEVASRALDDAGVDRGDVDLVIYTGVGRAVLEPAMAALVQHRLDLVNASCFDVLEACQSWLRAMQLARDLIACGSASTALIVNCEAGFLHMADLRIDTVDEIDTLIASTTIGEAVTATVVSAGDEPDDFHFRFRNLGQHFPVCMIPLPSYERFVGPLPHPRMKHYKFFADATELDADHGARGGQGVPDR